MKKISIVVPMYNEEQVVHICYNRITAVCSKLENYDYELVIVNDGSKDNTYELLKAIAKNDKRVKVISFSRNFGHESATIAGVKETTGDAVVVIDADMQDPPECIPDMIKLWEEGGDIIYAVRKRRDGEKFIKIFTSKVFYKILNRMSDVSIPRDTGDFRLIDRKVANVINNLPEHNKFFRGLVSWTGFKQIPYYYDREKRAAGKTKYSLKKLIKLALDAMISFSTKPLKIVGTIGIICIFVSFAILIYSLISYIFKLNGLVPGWTSIMVTVTFLAGLQFLMMYVMSEYIARIYDETRRRPEYIIDKEMDDENKK